jgi:hypothetical protein
MLLAQVLPQRLIATEMGERRITLDEDLRQAAHWRTDLGM